MKTLSVLGSTGSIGVQSLQVAESLGYRVVALTGASNIELLERQALRYKPRRVAVPDIKAGRVLQSRLSGSGIDVLWGESGLRDCAVLADTVVAAITGVACLDPLMAAVEAGKRIALANKEALVCAGTIITEAARRYGAELLPVDSEHSAVFQCLQDEYGRKNLHKLILTASGGAFRDRTDLDAVTPAEALRHPVWSMGAKITVDSATMINKGLECIEAMRLFEVSDRQVEVLLHRQSIVHSIVEFTDNSQICQMSIPDMRLPIAYALTWPERRYEGAKPLRLEEIGTLSFEPIDHGRFPAIDIAKDAARRGGLACCAMNAANELCVGMFLEEKLKFTDICAITGRISAEFSSGDPRDLTDVTEADKQARERALEQVGII